MSEPNSPADPPPLVTRVEDDPPAVPAPGPGLGEAVLWCLVFLATQLLGAIVVGLVVMGIFAAQAPDAGQFLTDQLAGLGRAMAKTPPADGSPRPPVPSEIGQSLAYGMLAAQFLSLGLILFVVPRRVGPDWKRQLGFRRPPGLHVFMVIVLVPGFMILSSGLQELLVKVTGIRQPAANEALNTVFRDFPWPLVFLAVSLGPGLVEEVWCRGFLGRGLTARYGLAAGVILTSLLFGFLHLDPSYALVTAAMGAYLHFVYLASRSIWVPILLHTLNNGIAIAATLAGVVVQLEADPRGLTKVIYLASFALVLFASIAMWTGRATVEPLKGDPDDWWASPGWKPEYPGVSAPPADSGARLVHETVSPAAVVLALTSFGLLVYLLSR